jgi:hypothetical protein
LITIGDEKEDDRKYSIPGKVEHADHYEPLFPMVIVAYRRYFWKAIMAFVHEHEQVLLCVCDNPSLTNDARDRIFELIVIIRCSLNANVTLEGFLSLKKCNLIETFPSKGTFPFK